MMSATKLSLPSGTASHMRPTARFVNFVDGRTRIHVERFSPLILAVGVSNLKQNT